MAEVIGAIGLAIAVFDQLVQAGERAARLISDVRDFDQDAERIQNDVSGENNSNHLPRKPSLWRPDPFRTIPSRDPGRNSIELFGGGERHS